MGKHYSKSSTSASQMNKLRRSEELVDQEVTDYSFHDIIWTSVEERKILHYCLIKLEFRGCVS